MCVRYALLHAGGRRGAGAISAGRLTGRRSKLPCKSHGVLPKQGKGAWVRCKRDFPGAWKTRGTEQRSHCDGPACIFPGTVPAIWGGRIPVPGSQQDIKISHGSSEEGSPLEAKAIRITC